MKLVTPLILVALAAGIFFGFAAPTWSSIQSVRAETSSYDEALGNSRELKNVRDSLLEKYNGFSQENVKRLQKMVPDSVDNVRLIMDISNLAARYGMSLKKVTVEDPSADAAKKKEGAVGPDEAPHGSIVLSFSVSASYDNFQRFMADLEKSLRLSDVVSLSFRSSDADLYEYNVSIRTYWLK